jgi:predicted ATPase
VALHKAQHPKSHQSSGCSIGRKAISKGEEMKDITTIEEGIIYGVVIQSLENFTHTKIYAVTALVTMGYEYENARDLVETFTAELQEHLSHMEDKVKDIVDQRARSMKVTSIQFGEEYEVRIGERHADTDAEN